MYENTEGPVEIDERAKWESKLFKYLYEFIEAYWWYDLRSLCVRLQALVLGNRVNGADMVARDSFSFLLMGKALHGPEIWANPLKNAARLDYYQAKISNIDKEYGAQYDGDDNLLPMCIYGNLTKVRELADTIAKHYEPIKNKILEMDVKIILDENRETTHLKLTMMLRKSGACGLKRTFSNLDRGLPSTLHHVRVGQSIH